LIEQGATDSWNLDWSWSPTNVIGVLNIQYRIDNGGWDDFDTLTDVDSGGSEGFTPQSYALPGDTLSFRAFGSAISGCPDIGSNVVGAVVQNP
jgi:hypothetical protein